MLISEMNLDNANSHQDFNYNLSYNPEDSITKSYHQKIKEDTNILAK